MSLIAMVTYCTEENNKAGGLNQVLCNLYCRIDPKKHVFIIVDNGSCEEALEYIYFFIRQSKSNHGVKVALIRNTENIGTARAINKAWALRRPGQHCIKMDDDILIHSPNWIEEMERAIEYDPLIGQVGLKRKDCWEFPDHKDDDWKSSLHMLPHTPGHPWVIVEKVKHVIGSCVMHSSALLDKVGFLYQPGLYGYDDVIMSHRAHLAGFYSCFLPHIEIDHIDPGGTPYQSWKEKYAGEHTTEMINLVHEMYNGTKPIYYEQY